jgi:hypothetical protein
MYNTDSFAHFGIGVNMKPINLLYGGVRRDFTDLSGDILTPEGVARLDGGSIWLDVRFGGLTARRRYTTDISQLEEASADLGGLPSHLRIQATPRSWSADGKRLNIRRPKLTLHMTQGAHTNEVEIIAIQLIFGRANKVYPTF